MTQPTPPAVPDEVFTEYCVRNVYGVTFPSQPREECERIVAANPKRYTLLSRQCTAWAPVVDPDECTTCGHHRDSHYEGFGACRILNPANNYGHGMCGCYEFAAGGA